MLKKIAIFCALLFCLTGCATIPDDPLERAEYEQLNDPLEPFNRFMFAGNQRIDRYVIRPLAEVYDYVPSFVRTRVDNLFDLLGTPFDFVNFILQGEREMAGNALARLLLNTILGLGGLFDVATAVGVPRQDTDFGITLGKWGVGEGPYIVLPILGPATVRSVAGRGVSAIPYTEPLYVLYEMHGITLETSLSEAIIGGVHARHGLLDITDSLERDSLDYYAATRSFYRQYRRGLVGDAPEEELILDYEGFGEASFDSLAPDFNNLAPALENDGEDDYNFLGPAPATTPTTTNDTQEVQ